MLHHVSVGVSDVQRASRFYDAVLAALGYRRVMEFLPYGIGYGDKYPSFWVQLPHNQQPASVGNGVHVSFIARNKEAVHRFHDEALAKGGTSDGEPGPRPDYGPDYYGAFVMDLDGNKVEATLTAMPKAAPKPKAKKAKAKAAKRPAKKVAKKPVKKAPPKKKAKRKAKK